MDRYLRNLRKKCELYFAGYLREMGIKESSWLYMHIVEKIDALFNALHKEVYRYMSELSADELTKWLSSFASKINTAD